MKTYSVKIERTVYSDKNYEIIADSELEAGEIAEKLAEDEWQETDPWVAPDWEYGHSTHEFIYSEDDDRYA